MSVASLAPLAYTAANQHPVPTYFNLVAQGAFSQESLADYIVAGVQHGFLNHFFMPPTGFHYKQNYKSARDSHSQVSTSLRKRLQSGQTLGPFDWDHHLPPSVRALCVDPLGSVPYKLEPDRAIQDPAANYFIFAPYFPMHSFQLIRHWSTPGCWYGLQDVEGAFPCLPLHHSM